MLRIAVVWIVALLAVAVAPGKAAEGPPSRPNVVLIVSDDQGWGDYGFMGHPHVKTPRIDRLASESLVFTRGYVPSSLCRPSLASLVSGRYPHEHRIVGNDPALPMRLSLMNARDRLSDPEYIERRRGFSANLDSSPTLPKRMVAGGYLAHQSGKWWEGDYLNGGFTHGMSHGDSTKSGRHGDEGLIIGRQTMQPVFEFLDEAREQQKPFFVFYAPMMPHTPHNPPERLVAKYRGVTDDVPLARYWAMCEWFDETVGQLLDGLEERGLTENTLVVYVTDNGWTQPKNEEPRAYGGPRGKRSPYEGGLRTPLMIRWPGRVLPTIDSEHLASSLDIVPTVLTAIGAAVPAEARGLNLLDPAAVASRETLFGEIYDHDATYPTRPAETLEYRWIVSGDWKLIVPEGKYAGDDLELFQVSRDPGEQTNLAAREPARVAELRQRLDAWWTPSAGRD